MNEPVRMSSPELTVYGAVYESHGVRYFRTPNCHLGIRTDRVKPFAGTVEKAETGTSGWVKVKLEGGVEFYIHQNWITAYGWLKPGDKIGGVLDVGESNFTRTWYVRKVTKEAIVGE